MASALRGINIDQTATPYPVVEQRRTTLTAGLEEDILHYGPCGVAPWQVYCAVVVPATTGDGLNFEWYPDHSNLTNNTMRVHWNTDPAADLTGMEVILRVEFPAMKSGGITTT